MQLKHIFNEHWTLINKTSHLESLAQKKTKTGVTNATVSAKANTSKHICSQSELLTWFSGVGYSAQHPHTCTHAHIQTHMVSLSPFWSRNENIKTHMNRAESKLLLWPRKKVQKNLLKLSRLKKKTYLLQNDSSKFSKHTLYTTISFYLQWQKLVWRETYQRW